MMNGKYLWKSVKSVGGNNLSSYCFPKRMSIESSLNGLFVTECLAGSFKSAKLRP